MNGCLLLTHKLITDIDRNVTNRRFVETPWLWKNFYLDDLLL